MEYTDEETIKALECCTNYGKQEDCIGCPIRSECNPNVLEKYALDLIPRQKAIIEKSEKVEHFADKTIETANAEIERLEKELMKCKLEKEMLYQTVEEIKSEAIKEFAEKLENEINCRTTLSRQQDKNVIHIIHNLLKEMAGEEE